MDFANAKRENVAMGKKVMIVEDNEFNLKLFTDLLRAHQFEVQGVRDGRLALDQAHIFAPDLVIMDIQLPHVSGADLVEAMQKDARLSSIPVLASPPTPEKATKIESLLLAQRDICRSPCP